MYMYMHVHNVYMHVHVNTCTRLNHFVHVFPFILDLVTRLRGRLGSVYLLVHMGPGALGPDTVTVVIWIPLKLIWD